ncbi:putative glycosyl transferase, family 31 [Helianthus anomalus]
MAIKLKPQGPDCKKFEIWTKVAKLPKPQGPKWQFTLLCIFYFRMFSNEDVTIGAWMLAMNVTHENNRQLCQPECTATSIAVWDIPKCSGYRYIILAIYKYINLIMLYKIYIYI